MPGTARQQSAAYPGVPRTLTTRATGTMLYFAVALVAWMAVTGSGITAGSPDMADLAEVASLPPFAFENSSICLVMIVRNEAHVVERSLRSVLPHISAWSIVDTGSTDETMSVIQRVLADVPGHLHQRRWVNFAHNRNEALELARPLAAWAFMLDADDVFHGSFSGVGSHPVDGYTVTHKAVLIQYRNTRLFSTARHWAYIGALHEYPALENATTLPLPVTTWVESRREGSRSMNPHKYRDDALLFETELQSGPPFNLRSVFYCAQSWRDAGAALNATRWYTVRAAASGGWVQERYVSLLNLVRLADNPELKLQFAWSAYDIDPTRVEATHSALRAARNAKAWSQSAFWLGFANAATAERSGDHLFTEPDVFAYQFHDEYSLVAFYTSHFAAAATAAETALAQAPPADKARIAKNLALSQEHARDALGT